MTVLLSPLQVATISGLIDAKVGYALRQTEANGKVLAAANKSFKRALTRPEPRGPVKTVIIDGRRFQTTQGEEP